MRTWLLGAALCVSFWAQVETTPTETNVDILEPLVIRSPARSVDPDDGFGWATIFHQVVPVLMSDSMDEAIRKTRFPICSAS